MAKTKAEIRFKEFIERIKKAKNDYDIAVAGWNLVEDYKGFNTMTGAYQASKIINGIFKKENNFKIFLRGGRLK